MDLVEHLSLCENILNESLNDNNKHSIKSFEDKDGTFVLQVATSEEDYTFNFHLIPKEEISSHLHTTDYDHGFYGNGDKDTLVEIRDIAVKGFMSVDFQEIDTTHLKSVLKSLARRYANEIKNNSFDQSFCRSYFLSQNYDNFLEDLFSFIEELDQDIDGHLLKEGIKTVIYTGEKALALNENILYINGNIFQKKIFFKEVDDDLIECKILNIGPSTPLPLVYDVLLVIFYFTDQETRQQRFHELVKYFYVALEECLNEMEFDITTILPLQKYVMHIRTFIPYVKLEMAHYYYQQLQKDVEKYKKLLMPAILELNECVLYPNLTREDCYEIVRNKIASTCYRFLSYKLIPLEERAGLMGDYFKLKIEIGYEDKVNVIHLFAKYVPTANETMRETSLSIFKKEEFVYGILIPEFIRVGLEDITDFLPRCFFLRPNDVIILEDLSEINYKPMNSKEPLSYEILLMVVKKLAKLHACCLLYEEILSKECGASVRIGDKYSEYIEEKFFQKAEEKLEKLHNVGISTAVNNIIPEYPDVPKDITLEEFQQKSKLLFESMFDKVRKSEEYRNVLCHGDIWTANILFKFEESEVTNCRIIDYQLTRYCPPAHDLLCLFYVNTNQAARSRYMSKLIDQYYSELLSIFRTYNFDLNSVYSYEVFMDSCEYMKPQAICQAALYYQTSLCPDIIGNLLDDRERFDQYCLVDRTDVMKEMMEKDAFRLRFKEIVEELYHVCVNR